MQPDLTIRDLLDHFEGKIDGRPPEILRLFDKHDQDYQPAIKADGSLDMHAIKGMACRNGDEIVVNSHRPFISNLDDLPVPIHELLPFEKYRMPLIKDPFTFFMTGLGSPAGVHSV